MNEIKVIGIRKIGKTDLNSARGFLKMVNVLRSNKPFVPKGVYRFKSFEESDQWMLKMMTRNYNQDFQK